ncbi:hypothetical protein DICPUDRAFT_74151 [Dictyostelium purpureum]|uniref:Rab GTPase n=1 Tax=Dictyostelium purpureum TaxID=5786 RepID=F0Z6X8_DICPU|nr:uncharacterized protein DICPUDRAFT_74151 [Dictyostelium purpureum]EGC40283.1 hypothetical protein DICPUDRAFT_74151 [Dictyostelium purpureum]|eukprot:XP_003283219.1 hypothetical protein DICPUDRAFT_74151 [Dictyostelium purpureum]
MTTAICNTNNTNNYYNHNNLNKEPLYNIKILFNGDFKVGKTSIVKRFMNEDFQVHHNVSTIGIDFKIIKKMVNDKLVKIQLWDQSRGCENRRLISTFYRGANVIIFTYDITNKESFENISKIWVKEYNQYITTTLHSNNLFQPILVLIGTKLDLRNQNIEKCVSMEQGKELAKQINAELFFEVSSLDNTGIDDSLNEILFCIINNPNLKTEQELSLIKQQKLHQIDDQNIENYQHSKHCIIN